MVERIGNTVNTSVSISKEFKQLMQEFQISPSEAFRKGIAVELCDRGVLKYNNELNRKRLEYIQQQGTIENKSKIFDDFQTELILLKEKIEKLISLITFIEE